MKLLTAKQVADILNCKPSSVYAWAKNGIIPAYKIGGLIRFDETEISNYIKNCAVNPISDIPYYKNNCSMDIDKIIANAKSSVLKGRQGNQTTQAMKGGI